MISSAARLRLVCQLVRLDRGDRLADTSIGELAKCSGMTRQMLGSILSEYDFRGWILIHIDEADQRSRRIELLNSFWSELQRQLGPLLNEKIIPVNRTRNNGKN